MPRPALLGLALVVAVSGCERRPPPAPAAIERSTATGADGPAGQALVARFECQRCHDGLDAPPVVESKHCVHCHQRILGGSLLRPATLLRRWQSRIVSLRQVPSLAGAGKLLRRDWVRDFLLAPRDVRPGLLASMPRLALLPADAEVLARYLVPTEAPADPPFTALEAAGGAEIYARSRCGSCHRFTGAPVDAELPSADSSPPEGVALAPDLALTRERIQPGALVAWLLDPQSVRPGSIMPRFPLRSDEVRALAAWLMTVPLRPPPPRSPPPRLPLLERRVGFEEVSERVLRKVCWHCHAQPDEVRGDGGPGNSGGFGFTPRGLDLGSLAGVVAGALGDDGQRHSVLAARRDGTPLLVAHLLARQREEAGVIDPEIRGMPLGLPSMSPEEIQLVETWISQVPHR